VSRIYVCVFPATVFRASKFNIPPKASALSEGAKKDLAFVFGQKGTVIAALKAPQP
jgi:hypothetical protein